MNKQELLESMNINEVADNKDAIEFLDVIRKNLSDSLKSLSLHNDFDKLYKQEINKDFSKLKKILKEIEAESRLMIIDMMKKNNIKSSELDISF